jgi:hypothetical protein
LLFPALAAFAVNDLDEVFSVDELTLFLHLALPEIEIGIKGDRVLYRLIRQALERFFKFPHPKGRRGPLAPVNLRV